MSKARQEYNDCFASRKELRNEELDLVKEMTIVNLNNIEVQTAKSLCKLASLYNLSYSVTWNGNSYCIDGKEVGKSAQCVLELIHKAH